MRSLALHILFVTWLSEVVHCAAALESLFFSPEGSASGVDAFSTPATASSKDAKINSTGIGQAPPLTSGKRGSTASKLKQASASTPASPRPPNVVYIMADQLRFDALGFIQARMQRYRGKLHVRTPNIDQLARQGTYFATTYCVAPSCGPSRAGIRTGCALQRTGVLDNKCFVGKVANRMDIVADRINQMVSFEQVLVEKVRARILNAASFVIRPTNLTDRLSRKDTKPRHSGSGTVRTCVLWDTLCDDSFQRNGFLTSQPHLFTLQDTALL
jgi:Sulfatase